MVRTQIQLTEEQARKLKAMAASTDQSMAALIRKAVEQLLAGDPRDRSTLYRNAKSVVGKYTADAADVAQHHDRYLKESFQS
ncbi:MAG: ribbon-helix-helix domain-containing protein [Desulfobacterales bacterium]|nr:ribbon-helix-helix domain-containing protein [Desulfobacterales bacterium]